MRKVVARLARQSPAMVVAMLALFVALTGTAVATTSALITGKSIKNGSITGLDIKNKSVTKADIKGQLRGARGVPGTPGVAGAKGDKGDRGDKGDKGDVGPFPIALPEGKTIKGAYYGVIAATAPSQWMGGSISYTYPLAATPTQHYIKNTDVPPAECPGTATNPQAASGHLCVYEIEAFNLTPNRNFDNDGNRFGTYVYGQSLAAGDAIIKGTWAVTGAVGTTAAANSVSASAPGP